MIGFYKDPRLGYAIGNHQMIKPSELASGLKFSGAQYTSPLIKEEHFMYLFLTGAYVYICFKVISSL